MSVMLGLMAMLGAQGIGVPPRRPDEEPLNRLFWYQHPEVSGHVSCNRAVRREQMREFLRRFEKRIARLTKVYEAVNGPDESFDAIALGRCRASDAQTRRAFDAALRDYAAFLRREEIRWGVRKR